MIPTVTVTGSYTDARGNPASGTVTFKLNTPLQDSTDPEVTVTRTPVVATLVAGTFTQVLSATSGGDILPASGVLYTVTEAITGAPARRRKVALPSSAPTVDMADVLPVDVTGVVWQAAVTSLPWFEVTDYGAAVDGVTDDLSAIQDAIDAAGMAGGGVVQLPVGSLAVSAPIKPKPNVTLRGLGPTASVIVPKASFTGTAVVSALTVDAADDMALEDFGIDFVGVSLASTCHGIRIDTASRPKVRRVRVNESRDVGLRLVASPDALVTECDVEFSGTGGLTTHGVEVDRTSHRARCINNRIFKPVGMGFFVEAEDVLIEANVIDGQTGGNGLEPIGVSQYGKRTKVIGNTCRYGGDNGISASADHMTVVGNTVYFSKMNGIYCAGRGGTAGLNTVWNPNRDNNTAYGGIKLDNATRWRIIGNTVRDDRTPKLMHYAFRAIGATASCMIALNDFSEYLTAAVGGDWNPALNTMIANAGAVAEVTGDRSDGTALVNLLASLAALGLITDSTVA